LLISFTVLRVVLLLRCLSDLGSTAPLTLVIGFLQDLQVVALFALFGLAFQALTGRIRQRIPDKVAVGARTFFTFIAWFFILFFAVCEFNFWSEFESRFNFIAVDYLIYTTEVVQNILQSFPVATILSCLAFVSLAITFFIQPKINAWAKNKISSQSRVRLGLTFTLILAASAVPVLSPETFAIKPAAKEVSSNGWKSLISAFFNNELSYTRFYKTLPEDQVEKLMQHPELAGHINQMVGSAFQRQQKLNVVLVVMESMSRKFLSTFGNPQNLTPNLDQLYKEGLSFSQVYATGTRTVRGLEAVDLSVPPTPGQSILRRPGFENLYSLGAYLDEAGYESQFLYGGYALFDNMGAFFAANHHRIIDRTDLKSTQIQFENAWGVCDEDMFRVAIEEADRITKTGRPFFQMIMTTSNHRPYTYPQHIDIPSGSGRDGAVKYSDYAVGELVKAAKTKPWFKNTVFIFVADHNASVAGRVELPLRDFPIPFIIYSPELIKPQIVDRLASQIDVAPTILDVLGLKYKNQFFGHSLMQPGPERAFVATYQSLGYLKNNILTVLEPKKRILQFDINGENQTVRAKIEPSLVDEAIAFYQFASARFQKQQMKNAGDNHVVVEGSK
jgi:phosphoglycerol transferase MdoB-like AlkP superfamily enzyme